MTPRSVLLLGLTGCVAGWSQTGFPFQDESLRYNLNWPSGLSLGEGSLQAKRLGQDRWQFELVLDASVAGLTVTDRFRSVAAGFCSEEFEKDSVHGPRKARETLVFDRHAGTVKRTTRSGGSSTVQAGSCVRDALAFLFFARRELGQGRVPAAETIYYGASYRIRMEYTGPADAPGGKKGAVADRVVARVEGPASKIEFEMIFARDAARTPLAIKVPFALGTFAMELAR